MTIASRRRSQRRDIGIFPGRLLLGTGLSKRLQRRRHLRIGLRGDTQGIEDIDVRCIDWDSHSGHLLERNWPDELHGTSPLVVGWPILGNGARAGELLHSGGDEANRILLRVLLNRQRRLIWR